MNHSDPHRILYLDCLRIFATIAVIFIHVSSQNWYSTKPSSPEWNIFNFYDSIVRFGVPVFVMISGALFLNTQKKISIRSLYQKNITRIITAFLFWSVLYVIYDHHNVTGFEQVISKIIKGPYHMWFLYMITGLYLITPLLKPIVRDRKLTIYFLLLSFILTFLVPAAANFFPVVASVYKKASFHFTLGYTSYYVAGMYLNENEISPKLEKFIYILSLIGFAATIIISAVIARSKGEPYGYYSNYSIFVMLESLGVFIFFKNHVGKINFSHRQKQMIYRISNYSFGIYLVHVMVLKTLKSHGLTTMTFHPALSVPVIALIVFLISYVISAVMHRIPVLKNYVI